MTTKELIDILQKIDPDGDTTVCIDNRTIVDVHRVNSDTNGFLEEVEIDEHGNYVSVKYVKNGEKIDFVAIGAQEAIYDNPDILVDFREVDSWGGIEKLVDRVESTRRNATRFVATITLPDSDTDD